MQELNVKSLLPVRLDKYLMQQFPALGPGRLNKALRENKIKLNGKSSRFRPACKTATPSACF